MNNITRLNNIQLLEDITEEYLNFSRNTRHSIQSVLSIIETNEQHLYEMMQSQYNLVGNTRNTADNSSSIHQETNTFHNEAENDNDDNSDGEILSPLPQNLSLSERFAMANRNAIRRPSTSRGISTPRVTVNRELRNASTIGQSLRDLNNQRTRENEDLERELDDMSFAAQLQRNQNSNTIQNNIGRSGSNNRNRRRTPFTFSTPVVSFSSRIPDLWSNLSPVPIVPSNEQIENATELVRFGDLDDPINRTCPITQEPFTDDETVTQILYCKHLFTATNLQRWFRSNSRCPLCRYDIRNYSPLRHIHNPYRNAHSRTRINSDISNNSIENDTEENNHNASTATGNGQIRASANMTNFLTQISNDIIREINRDSSANNLLDRGQSLSLEYNFAGVDPLSMFTPLVQDPSNRDMRTFVSLSHPPDHPPTPPDSSPSSPRLPQ
jgi:hypothetical protein